MTKADKQNMWGSICVAYMLWIGTCLGLWQTWNAYKRTVELVAEGKPAAANLMQIGLASHIAILAIIIPVMVVFMIAAYKLWRKSGVARCEVCGTRTKS